MCVCVLLSIVFKGYLSTATSAAGSAGLAPRNNTAIFGKSEFWGEGMGSRVCGVASRSWGTWVNSCSPGSSQVADLQLCRSCCVSESTSARPVEPTEQSLIPYSLSTRAQPLTILCHSVALGPTSMQCCCLKTRFSATEPQAHPCSNDVPSVSKT